MSILTGAKLHSNQDTSQKSHMAKGVMEKEQYDVRYVWLEANLHSNCVYQKTKLQQTGAHLQHEAISAPIRGYPIETGG